MASYIHNFSLRYRPYFAPNSQPHKPLSFLPNSLSFKKPISYYSLITSSSSPHKAVTNFIPKKLVIFLVGSLVFMGGFNMKPVLAQPVTETSQSQTQYEEFDEEEMRYMRLLEDNPKSVEALKMVFYAKMKRGKTKAAIEYVERLISLERKEVEWRLLQALCYDMIGDLSMAKTLFKKILKKRPLLPKALHGLAMVMHKNQEGPAVFEMLDKALKLAREKKRVTEERNIRILIAQMHVVKGELDEALELLKDLVDENPRDFRPYLCQGIVYSLLDRKDEAEQQFSTYQSLVPDEFAERGFLDDVVLAAKTESTQHFKP